MRAEWSDLRAAEAVARGHPVAFGDEVVDRLGGIRKGGVLAFEEVDQVVA